MTSVVGPSVGGSVYAAIHTTKYIDSGHPADSVCAAIWMTVRRRFLTARPDEVVKQTSQIKSTCGGIVEGNWQCKSKIFQELL